MLLVGGLLLRNTLNKEHGSLVSKGRLWLLKLPIYCSYVNYYLWVTHALCFPC